MPGIVFNPSSGTSSTRRPTSAGAYRLEPATNRWIPLLDWVGWDSWGWNGVASLASDPVEFDRVYVAAGMYTNSSDPNNGAILRSADYGGAGQQVRDLWNGTFTQSGALVTVTNASWNGTLAANGGSAEVGFNGSWSGSNPKPTAFTLNGAACAVS